MMLPELSIQIKTDCILAAFITLFMLLWEQCTLINCTSVYNATWCFAWSKPIAKAANPMKFWVIEQKVWFGLSPTLLKLTGK